MFHSKLFQKNSQTTETYEGDEDGDDDDDDDDDELTK